MAVPHPDALLRVTGHRPWPLPDRPWLMQQSWHDLLFAHWPVPAASLRPLVPAQLPIDTFEGRAWVGIVPFEVRNARPRGLPGVPGATRFLETNVRTYATLGGKPGVYFFSLDAASALAVLGARTFFRLRYFEAHMAAETDTGWTHYRSRRLKGEVELECRYRARGQPGAALPGTLDHFLTERYCLYSAGPRRTWRVDIHHPPWPLQSAECELARNTMASAQGIALPSEPPLLHYSAEQHVLVWPPEEVT